MKKAEKFIMREIAGEHVMMPTGKTAQKFSGMILANDVAAFIWKNIEKVDSAEEMVKLICSEYEVSEEEAFADTKEIMTSMKNAGWIE